MTIPFTTTTHPAGPGITRLAVAGDVAWGTSDAFRELIINALDAAGLRELIVDLDAVPYIDSSGLGALIAGRNTAHHRGISYRIINPQAKAHRILQITGLLALLTDPEVPS